VVTATQRLELAGLTTRIVGPKDATVTCVLLHGFGAPGDDLVSLADHIDAPARFIFPEAPLELSGMGGGARAWWLLDLAKLEHELRSGAPRDRRDEIPDGLPSARAQMLRFLEQVQARFTIPDERLVIGGFSQGAMLATDIALHRAKPPAGIIAMSGTLIAEADWQPRLASLAGVPILMSHGRSDMLLPFSVAEVLRDKLIAVGAKVEWVPFLGGHEIPTAVLASAGAFLTARAA
jgi:phospholipase/carboxylesterase